MSLTPKGKADACLLIAYHLERRNLPVETIAPITAEQILQILLCWGAMMTEQRPQVWFERMIDQILELERAPLKRFWVSWWSAIEAPAGELKAWLTGQRFDAPERFSYCALIDAESEAAAWAHVRECCGDYLRRFILEKPADWTPGERFR